MIHAAGILFLCGDSALFLRRGNGSDHPNEWAIPGGHVEEGETAQQAAIRETFEESGATVSPNSMKPWVRTVAPAETPIEQATVTEPAVEGEPPAPSEDVDFTTFVVRLKEQFTPVLCDEHDGYCWAPLKGAPQPLHPGIQAAIDRFDMDELGVARAIAAGTLASPQKYENVWLFAIRITGTGVSYRHARKEFVWRDPEIYMNEEFLARCNGLAVIYEHPEKSLLNHDEFHDRKVGTTFLPYLREDLGEVWAVVKIYDDDVARELRDEVMSTSPAVNFADPSVNERVRLEDGKVMLIEGKPSLLDHIAICRNGVWDKGGDPTGVESIEAMVDSIELVPETSYFEHRLNTLRLAAGVLGLKASMIR